VKQGAGLKEQPPAVNGGRRARAMVTSVCVRPVLYVNGDDFDEESKAIRLAERQRPERIGDIAARLLPDLLTSAAGPGRAVLYHRRNGSVREVRERRNRPRLPRVSRRTPMAGGLAVPNRWGDAGGGSAPARPAGLSAPKPIRPEVRETGDPVETAPPASESTRCTSRKGTFAAAPWVDDVEAAR